MIKVLHVISDTGIGGAGILLLNLMRHADRRSFSYAVALPRGSLLLPKVEALGIPVFPLDGLSDRSVDPPALPELVRLVRRERPDILHTHAGFTARLAGYLTHIPAILCTKHCAFEPSKRTLPFQKALNKTPATYYIATAEAAGSVLTAEGAMPQRICLIRGGSDPVQPLPNSEKEELRREIGLTPTDFVVGMAARMERGKGQEILLEAAKICLSENPRFRFLLAGTGSMEKELRCHAQALRLGDGVRFLGFRSDIGRIMNLFDLNVNCSYLSETSSLSLSEGMSLGIVPVVSDIGGNPFMVGYGQDGVLVPSKNPEALAVILLSLYRSPRSRAALSRRCRARFEAEFTAESMTRKTEALYREVLDKRRSPQYNREKI